MVQLPKMFLIELSKNITIFCTTKCQECECVSLTLVSFGGRFPVLSADHRQAHLALLIDVGVINLCLKSDLRRFEGVLRWENDFNFERTFVIRRVILEEWKTKLCYSKTPKWYNLKWVIWTESNLQAQWALAMTTGLIPQLECFWSFSFQICESHQVPGQRKKNDQSWA